MVDFKTYAIIQMKEVGMIEQWKKFNIVEKAIILTLCSIYFHYTITIGMIIVSFMLIIKYEWKKPIKEQRPFILLSFLQIISIINSAWHKNILGILLALGMWIILYVVYYLRTFISKDNIYWILKMLLGASLISIMYITLGYFINKYIIHVVPYDYSKVIFFNENYAGSVFAISAIIAMILLLQEKKKYYLLFILSYIFLIINARSRGALLGLIAGIIIVGFTQIKNKKIKLTIAGGIFITIVIMLCIFPLPSIHDFTKLDSYRVAIWETGWKSFLRYPLIGQGQFTHLNYCREFGTLCIEHAHNLFLELLIVYGVFGIAVIMFTLKYEFSKIVRLMRNDMLLFSLYTGVITVSVIHGLVDYQLFWPQSGLLCLSILGIIDCYKEEKKHE